MLIFVSLGLMLSNLRLPAAPSPKVAAGVGLVSGLMSGLAQIGGPPVVMYWLSAGVETVRMRANLIVYFAILMWSSLALFAFRGLLPAKVLWLAAAAAPDMHSVSTLVPGPSALPPPPPSSASPSASSRSPALLGMPALDPFLRWGR